MKLLALEAENVKRLRAIALTFKDNMTVIEGRNGQGKTSAIDSIWYALAGAGSLPPEVLRRGAEKGRSLLNFGDFTVERKFTPKSSTLAVTMRDGKKVASPQTFLDALAGPDGLAFDPLLFLGYDKAKRLDVVKRIAGVDLTALDERKAKAFESRTTLTREGKELRARVQAFAPDPAGLPEQVVDVAELLAEQRAKLKQLEHNRLEREALKLLAGDVLSVGEDLDDVNVEVTRLERELREAKERRDRLALHRADLDAKREAKRAEVEQLVDPDLAATDRAIASADATNTAVRRRVERAQLEQQLEAKLKEHAKLEREVDDCDVERRRLVREAKFPIDGLGFTVDGVTFKDVPFEQASQAEQLRVAMAIALALNPKLKLVLIRSGSLIDSAGLALIAEMATKADAQVIVERVADKPGTGFFIEDGALLEAEVTA